MLATSAEDRNRDIAGPMFQEIVAVQEKNEPRKMRNSMQKYGIAWNRTYAQERIGDWIHCENGWLPLCIGRASWGTFA